MGAILRACLCLDSRVLVVLGEPDLETHLHSLWISDYFSPVILSDARSITLPLWRGQLLMVSGNVTLLELPFMKA